MKLAEAPEFSHVAQEEVYDHVERRGSVRADAVRTALDMDPTTFGHAVAILKRDGVLDESEDGRLSVAFEPEGLEEHTTDEGIEFVIRQARQSDLSGLVGTMRAVVDDDYFVAESVAELVDREEVLLRHNDLETRIFFVATVGDDVVGWVHVAGSQLGKLGHTAELTVGVLGEYRGHDIGSHLLVRGVGWAAANGYGKIYNSVPATNQRAVDFLTDHGWEVEAVREGHYLIDGEYVDEVMAAVEV